ncbi:MAG: YezD family protein [Candidatus Omnitrophota bacterium]
MVQKKEIEQRVIEEVIKSIQQISYGEVVLTIHNSKVVQIEKKEKKRFSLE